MFLSDGPIPYTEDLTPPAAVTVQTGLRVSEVCSLTIDDVYLGTGPHVTCTGKGRRQRITPLTSATVSVMTAYFTERTARPGTALFCGPRGQALSRDALEHRLATYVAAAVIACPGLAGKHVTMHTLRHTAAMNCSPPGLRRRHRAVARARRHPQHRRIPPRRHGHRASSPRPNTTTRRKARGLPPRARHPRLARSPLTMPTIPRRMPHHHSPSQRPSA
ncbi:tyrosine-type recombinase/integrase [Nocardioides sp. S5]|uniref:tyrosine-type recombinase/integrase n=1 Tax=Nocardioides sp. S5 TaxID=2017486 RepID=UPI001F5C4C3E|nr:tyrosine-type recombinase/integrase [Nocardioides sp. S5]